MFLKRIISHSRIFNSLKIRAFSNMANQLSDKHNSTIDYTKLAASRVSGMNSDVWTIFTQVSQQFNTINLGQGFMSFPAPDFVKQAGCDAILADKNQYSPPMGIPRLRNALAKNYSPLFGRELDPNKQILVTTGANEGIFCAISAFIEAGDEAIFIEPFFDQYLSNLTMNGGIPVYCPLRLDPSVEFNKNIPASSYKINLVELESKITAKTKLIIVNTPHNPVGKVFSKEELIGIGELAEKHNLIIISDEVYDRLYYKPHDHIRLGSLEKFWKRTVTVGSAGKTFGVTGWRVGWLIGPDELIRYCLAAHTRICFCTDHPIQDAVASAFEQAESNGYFEQIIKDYQSRKDVLAKAFDDIGLPYVIPEGSYFILVNTDKLKVPREEWDAIPEHIKKRGLNYMMCYWIAKTAGVTAIPASEFYSEANAALASNLARFAFCKSEDLLQQASVRLSKLKNYI